METKLDTKAIRKAVARCGGNNRDLAEKIGVATPLVYQWVTGRRPVAARHAIPIEEASGVSRHEIAPEVFGAPPKRAKSKSQAVA